MLTSMASALLTNSQTDDPGGAVRSCPCPCAGVGASRAARESRCHTPPEVFAEAPEPSVRPVAVHDVLDQVARACRPVPAPDRPSQVMILGVTREDGYLLDNQHAQAGTRFEALSTLFNPSTFRHIEALGIKRGWRCWEVGAGGPSVPGWLAEQVAPEGYVLASDIDVSWMTKTDQPTYEIRRHDVGAEGPPSGGFDLVHARLVLAHVARRAQALAAMVTDIRPGGWLLVEEADPGLQPLVCPDEYGPNTTRPTSSNTDSAP
jgi:hypothetical protein